MLPAEVRIAFEQNIVVLPLASILPLKQTSGAVKKLAKYRRISQSISEVGIIEPLVVSRLQDESGNYLLLDGHARREILIDLGKTDARCIISHDDEAFTYNKRINHLATVQEHLMIVRALKSGVSEEKLARALDVEPSHIRRRKMLLDGICSEVVDALKDRMVNPVTFDVLRKMKPTRQIEAAELMLSAAIFSSTYAKALLAATKQIDLAKPNIAKRVAGMTPEQMARMEREMETLQTDFKAVESSYGEDVLNLVIASGYISKLIGNANIERYLSQNHPEVLQGLRAIASVASLDSAA